MFTTSEIPLQQMLFTNGFKTLLCVYVRVCGVTDHMFERIYVRTYISTVQVENFAQLKFHEQQA